MTPTPTRLTQGWIDELKSMFAKKKILKGKEITACFRKYSYQCAVLDSDVVTRVRAYLNVKLVKTGVGGNSLYELREGKYVSKPRTFARKKRGTPQTI